LFSIKEGVIVNCCAANILDINMTIKGKN